ncbi:Uma2 family endonuclease [Streptomyces albicerus]|uniref:Uma2 family endonuclease n=1 Tax=Streptomyces albicerus TaxID=2569859 RepID=UPI001CEC9EE7|nr:Uma2 family endonuclease [Streptomyces albicerus]
MAVIQDEMTIADAADRVSSWLPGHRVEILKGSMIVTPPPDGAHAMSLTWLMGEFHDAGARRAGVRYGQAIGLWLSSGPDDYAVPDFAVVDADFMDAHVQKNCYAPNVFRLVLEVTSSNWADDTLMKVECYANSGIPAYVVVDRKHDLVVVHSGPEGDKYATVTPYKRGTTVPLPSSIGVTVELSADRLLDGDDD